MHLKNKCSSARESVVSHLLIIGGAIHHYTGCTKNLKTYQKNYKFLEMTIKICHIYSSLSRELQLICQCNAGSKYSQSLLGKTRSSLQIDSDTVMASDHV